MFNISGFLERFKKFGQNQTLQTENVIKKIESVIGVRVDKKDIVIKDGVLHVHGSPALRQEIFLRKELLLPLIADDRIFDIR
jgi:hypothetical protein